MGKFAWFLKRIKWVVGFVFNILSKLNDVYKFNKIVVNYIVSPLLSGGYINQILDFWS